MFTSRHDHQVIAVQKESLMPIPEDRRDALRLTESAEGAEAALDQANGAISTG